jgi:hypothetical protein
MTDPKHLFRQPADGSHFYPASALYLFTPVTGAAGELIGHHIRAIARPSRSTRPSLLLTGDSSLRQIHQMMSTSHD